MATNGSGKRRSLRKRAASIGSSVAGTLTEVADDVKQRVKRRKARKELEDYRSDEVTDQGQARLERARREAEREARKEARKEAASEVKEARREEVKEDELQKIRKEYGIAEDEGGSRVDDGLANILFGPGGVTNDDPTVMVGVDADRDGEFQPGEVSLVNPGGARVGPPPRDTKRSSGGQNTEEEEYDPEKRLGEIFGAGPENPHVGPMMDDKDDGERRSDLPFF